MIARRIRPLIEVRLHHMAGEVPGSLSCEAFGPRSVGVIKGALRRRVKSLFVAVLVMTYPHSTVKRRAPGLALNAFDRARESYDWINAKRSALIVSGFVVCMPWQKPL